MPVSDEELQAKQSAVEKLREQVAAEETKRVLLLQEYQNDATAAALDSEAETLRAQLADLKAGNTKAAVKQGAAIAVDPEGVAAKQEAAAADEKTTTKERA